jgi:heme oxygenase
VNDRSYLAAYETRTGAMWREFRELATEEVGDDVGAVHDACESAQRTFDALIETFRPLACTEAGAC